jgi:hypothetical protein
VEGTKEKKKKNSKQKVKRRLHSPAKWNPLEIMFLKGWAN